MNTKISIILMLFGFFAFVVIACTNVKNDQYDEEKILEASLKTCEGCHTNLDHLKEVYTPDEGGGVSGCGGDAPHYEPYDRVHMGGAGYTAFKESGHYGIGCTGCHNGNDNVDSSDKTGKEQAHSGDFIAHPSEHYQDKCASCHEDITNGFTTSIHHGTGQKRKVSMRNGLEGAHEFDKLSETHKAGYNKNCATCHGTCGNCHIVRPLIAGGGLADGHNFNKKPDMVSTCAACHTSRGWHAYAGIGDNTVPDVHFKELGYKCMDCHTGAEIHGDGQPVERRYAYEKLPKCTNCHADANKEENDFHEQHYSDFNCQVCHSQDYNNCGSCHIPGDSKSGAGARVPAYMDFKIALNPIKELKPRYKFVLVRRTLGAPDNWKEYGIEEYADFNVFPTYNYTSPHNIQKLTSRTNVPEGKSCYYNCHIRRENGEFVNKDLYLFSEDMEFDWEIPANKDIVVDDKLPTFWMK